MTARMRPIVALFVIFQIFGEVYSVQYHGKLIGKLSELHHGVSGEVYAVDGRTLYIKDFTYDGQGPAAYFYAGTSRVASSAGFRLKDENQSGDVLRRYRKEGVTITLPEGKTLNNIKIFYVWCEEFDVNFGDVKIPRNFDYPRPQKIDPLKGVHAISSDNIVIVDAQTLLIPNLSYDGEAPDAKFWVGRGPKPSPQGIRVPDENGKEVPLRRYDRKTIVLTLPGELTVFDIGHFGIWCEAFTVDFGHVQIPSNLNVPPSLKMLGVSPQSKLNCEVLYDDLAFEVRWAVAGDSIVLQLVAKLENREYMSFGLSGNESHNVMIGGDVAVAWVDKETLKGYAEDYYLSDKSQCSGPTGSCPDNRIAENTNNVRLLNAAMVNGYSIVTYQRPLRASDFLDKPILTNTSQAVIWAIGPLNQRDEVSFHSHWTKDDLIFDFGRTPKWNCPMPESEPPSMKPITQYVEETTTTTTEATKVRNSERRRGSGLSSDKPSTTVSRGRQPTRIRNSQVRSTPKPVPTPAPVAKRDAWEIPPIQCHEPEDGVFYAQMGPTGGKRGYPAITGHVGWGISWYINGLLIPEINVVRGKTYTFVVEGGFDPEVPAKYHPFYITDDSIGGYEYKTEEEKKNVKIFAGAQISKDGTVTPTGTGRLCHWTQTGDLDADDFESFGAYQRTLELKCDQGEPGVIQWTPDKDTPDTVYYQCFTHRYLGWKINVHDSCDTEPAASEPKPVHADLDDEPSIRVETRVKPNDLTNDDKKDKNKSTISETAPIPSIDPPLGLPSPPPPQHQLEPILFQPQQSFFTPPMYTMSHHHHHGPFFTTYNPYAFDHHPYHHYQNTFKPSPLIDEEGRKITSTSTTTEKPSAPKAVAEDDNNNNNKTTNVTTTSNTQIHVKHGYNGKPFPRWPQQQQRPFGKFPPINRPLRSPHPLPPYKKPIRPVMRFPPGVVPRPSLSFPFKLEKPMFYFDKPPGINYHKRSNFIAMKPLIVSQQISTSTTTQSTSIITEKEPEIQTAPPLSMSFKQTEHTFKLPPAHNTGFHPESVVIESGFKPIISKDFQRRMDFHDNTNKEFDDYDELGVITLNQILPKEPRQEYFEPVFVPSPEEKKLKRKKTPRSNLDDEPLAEAAERVESFYLPPPNQQPKEAPPQQRSNVDIDSPGVLVTYDGKILSGDSLTAANIADSLNILEQRTSKAAEFIKARPQFGPFRGELPPLGSEHPQFESHGFLSRDLDAPKTKLVRRTRAAHHTPEHTEEQRRQQQQQQQQNTNDTKIANSTQIPRVTTFVILIAFFVNFF